MRRSALPVLALTLTLLALIAAGCGAGGGGESADGSDDDGGRRFLSVGTAPPGGAFFVVGGAIAEVLDGAHPQWQVTAEATAGSQENIRRLTQGEIDLALSNAAITYFAVRGEGWDKAYEVASVMTLAPNVALFVTRQDSGVRTLQDLTGRRVVIGPAAAGFEYFVRPLLDGHGVDYDQLSVLHGSQSGAVDLMADGSAAAAFLGGAVPTASITQAAISQDIYFIPFHPQTRQQLIDRYPFFRPAVIPAGTYRGQEEDFEGLDVGSMHLITAADADEELVYQLTKSLYERREEVVAKHPAGRAINPANAARDTGTPFHPGAERYYREIGIWPDAAGAGEPAAPADEGAGGDAAPADEAGDPS